MSGEVYKGKHAFRKLECNGTPRGNGVTRIELEPSGEKFKLFCCDCNLVHDIAVAVEKNGKIGFTLRRNQSETKRMRGE